MPILTKYELANILATRAAEIADGHAITIRDPGTDNPREIAELEFKAGRSPKKVIRRWPDGHEEVWSLSELHVV